VGGGGGGGGGVGGGGRGVAQAALDYMSRLGLDEQTVTECNALPPALLEAM
jgi:hypothetical protein